MKTTIKDIANITGFSVATVSRALNGKADVGEETRSIVCRVARELNYHPNAFARGLQKSRGYAIGIIISDISNAYFSDVFRGAEECAAEEGYSILFTNTDYNAEKEREALRLLSEKRVDGLIMQISNQSADECRKMVEMGYPIVLLGQMLKDVDCPMVGCNNFSSAFTMTEYLIGKGHRKIAHIGGHADTNTGIERMEGFRSAMLRYGLEVREEWVRCTDYEQERAYKECCALFDLPEKPTAVFTANDDIAVACYRAAYERGIRIPEDISVAGHDDTSIATILRPNLTTMRQKKREIGRCAVQKLLDVIDSRKKLEREITVIPTELVVRDSVLGV